MIRGIRGAIRVRGNTRKDIFTGTKRLMRALLRENRVEPDNVAACFFTMTPDLNADFPAYAARELAQKVNPTWKHIPMICAQELSVPGSLDRVVRILIMVNTDAPPEKIRHQYMGDTKCLRPDLARTAPKRRRRK